MPVRRTRAALAAASVRPVIPAAPLAAVARVAAGEQRPTGDATPAALLLSVAVVVAVALAAGAVARRLGQPRVIGEIVAGILLGPTALGHLPGDIGGHLFPPDVRPVLAVVAQLGVVLFMFLVGAEADPGLVRGRERIAVSVSLASIAAPFALGIVAAVVLHGRHGSVAGRAVTVTSLALFLGAAMSVTAFPVLARIIAERGLARTPLGAIVLAAAAVDDVVAWALLAGVLALVASTGAGAVVTTVVLTAVWLAVMVLVVRPLLALAARRLAPDGGLPPTLFTLTLGVLLLSAWATSRIGIHLIIGAFVAGVVAPGGATSRLRHELVARVEPVTVTLLLPIFFVVTGLGVDLGAIDATGLLELLLIVGVAVSGKLGGAVLAARANGLPPRRALAIGTLMNTRGLTELVILSVGRDIGVLDAQLYALLVVMAIATTVMTGPLLSVVYPPRLVAADLADDLRAAQGGGPRVLAVVGAVTEEGYDAAPAAVLAVAAAVAGSGGAVTLSRFLSPVGVSVLGGSVAGGSVVGARSSIAAVGIALAELQAQARGVAAAVTPAALLVEDPVAALRTQTQRLRPDLVVLARSDLARGLGAETGVEVASVVGAAEGSGPVRLVLSGDLHDGPAAVVAARLARGLGVGVELVPGRDGPSPRRLAAVAEHLLAGGVLAQVAAAGPAEPAQGGWTVTGASGREQVDGGTIAVAGAETALRLDVLERLDRALAPVVPLPVVA